MIGYAPSLVAYICSCFATNLSSWNILITRARRIVSKTGNLCLIINSPIVIRCSSLPCSISVLTIPEICPNKSVEIYSHFILIRTNKSSKNVEKKIKLKG